VSDRLKPGKREAFVAARDPRDASPYRRLRLRTSDGEVEEMMMTAEQLRRLKRSVAEARETRRYVIESSLGPGFTFFYNVSHHGYGLNEPSQATLFHQRNQALAVSRLLGKRVRVVRYQTRLKDGIREAIVPRSKVNGASRGGSRRRRTRS
jgi:hypothetical protein